MGFADSFIEGHKAGQAEQLAKQQRDLQKVLLQHTLKSWDIEDKQRAFDAAKQKLDMLNGRPSAELPSDIPDFSQTRTTETHIPGIAAPLPGVTLPQAQPSAVQFPDTGAGGFSVRPQSMESIIAAKQAADRKALIDKAMFTPQPEGSSTPGLVGLGLQAPAQPKLKVDNSVMGPDGVTPVFTDDHGNFYGMDHQPLKAGDVKRLVPLQKMPAVVNGKQVFVNYNPTTGAMTDDTGSPVNATPIPPQTRVSLSGMNSLYSATDPKAIAAAIRSGDAPPDLSNYGRVVQGAVASELLKPGPNGEKPFNLTAAQREWKSQLKLNQTMNGPQQVRLDESIRSGLAMYDEVDKLAEQWDGMGLGPLSRANLALARKGGLGQKAQSLANQLTGQIGQLTSDIATIEQGGLTPTNEARAVAEKSLQDWWSKGTIQDMTAQGRYNMQIRHMARETQAPFVSGSGAAPAVPATPAGGATSLVQTPPPDQSGTWKWDGKAWVKK